MVIDCHGHYTTAPKELQAFRDEALHSGDERADRRIEGFVDAGARSGHRFR